MIVPRAHLVPHVFDRAKLEGKPTRMGYGEGLVSAADENKNIVALCADLTESTQTHHFQKKYPFPALQSSKIKKAPPCELPHK